jgi:type IV pilus assembly protein PilW
MLGFFGAPRGSRSEVVNCSGADARPDRWRAARNWVIYYRRTG